jgi:GntR family transcriptional regulator/MocR family aminotransferase
MTPGPRIRVDTASGTPAVRQIADQLRVLLVDGQLPPGVALPSVRRLAMELGVHFNTVAEAYRQLAAEGWLELKHGRTALVVHREVRPLTDRNKVNEFRDRLRGLVAQMRAEGVPALQIAAELRDIAKMMRQT